MSFAQNPSFSHFLGDPTTSCTPLNNFRNVDAVRSNMAQNPSLFLLGPHRFINFILAGTGPTMKNNGTELVTYMPNYEGILTFLTFLRDPISTTSGQKVKKDWIAHSGFWTTFRRFWTAFTGPGGDWSGINSAQRTAGMRQ